MTIPVSKTDPSLQCNIRFLTVRWKLSQIQNLVWRKFNKIFFSILYWNISITFNPKASEKLRNNYLNTKNFSKCQWVKLCEAQKCM